MSQLSDRAGEGEDGGAGHDDVAVGRVEADDERTAVENYTDGPVAEPSAYGSDSGGNGSGAAGEGFAGSSLPCSLPQAVT